MDNNGKNNEPNWIESVQLVFDYFSERTPRSYVETRGTSLVWSYKYADPDFGRQQARDLLQHLWTGPISNAAVDVIQELISRGQTNWSQQGCCRRSMISMMGECGSSSLVKGKLRWLAEKHGRAEKSRKKHEI